MTIGVWSGGDGGSLSITSNLSSFKSIQEVTMIEGKSLVRNAGDASIFSGDSVGVYNLSSGSGSTAGGSVWLIGGKGGLDKERGVSIILDIISSTCCIVDTCLIRSRQKSREK